MQAKIHNIKQLQNTNIQLRKCSRIFTVTRNEQSKYI